MERNAEHEQPCKMLFSTIKAVLAYSSFAICDSRVMGISSSISNRRYRDWDTSSRAGVRDIADDQIRCPR